jgi:multidrug efflux pump subunit AcrB
MGVVTVEMLLGADTRKVLDDVKSRVDAIDTFPAETEAPIITELTNRAQVINVAVSGDADEASLRYLAESVRDELAALPEITLTELASARPYEISIEISEDALRRHGLSFDQVANAVRRSSLDLPGGRVKTAGGEILLRTKGQAYRGQEFDELVLFSRGDGTRVRLGDVARVIDGFADTDQSSLFNGKPAVHVQIFRVGDQDALSVSAAVRRYVEQAQPRMPAGIELTPWQDSTRILEGRRDLLLRNGATGLTLVFIGLALFLRFRLAFWVAVGLLISFMGAIWLMPALGVTINLISLFAFILVLGIVVDDAIIAGENIYTHQHRHGQGLRGSIEGAQEISKPVIFAVLTTVAAFAPLLNVPGTMGKVMRVIPLIVIPCLLWSLVESLWILPAHLSHYREKETQEGGRWIAGPWRRFQSRFANGLRWFIDRVYAPSLELGLRWRYLTVAVGIATLLITVGLVRGGFVKFVFFPEVESDYIAANVTMAPGTSVETTTQVVRALETSAELARAELEQLEGANPFLYVSSAIGEMPYRQAQRRHLEGAGGGSVSSNIGEVSVELTPAEERDISSLDIVARWRELTGPIPDATELTFTASLFSPGDDVDVQLTGRELGDLRAAAEELKLRLGEYTGVFEISDSFVEGKREVKLDIKPEAESRRRAGHGALPGERAALAGRPGEHAHPDPRRTRGALLRGGSRRPRAGLLLDQARRPAACGQRHRRRQRGRGQRLRDHRGPAGHRAARDPAALPRGELQL